MEDWDKVGFKGIFEREKRKLFSRPLEFFLLSELEFKEYYVNLSNEAKLVLKSEDIERIKTLVPKFLHEKLKIPLVIHITMNPRCRFRVMGDIWQLRIVEMLIRDKMSWKPDACLSESEFMSVLKHFGSLVHVSFSEELTVIENEELEE